MEPTRRTFMAAAVAGLLALPSLVSAQRDDRRDDRKDDRRDDRRPAPAAADRWERLGERTVGKREEHDTIELKGKQRFTAVWFEVDRGAIDLDDIRITFGNKESFDPKISLTFREGQKTRLIDLPGDDREIVKIDFHYRSVGRGESTIVAWGRVAGARR